MGKLGLVNDMVSDTQVGRLGLANDIPNNTLSLPRKSKLGLIDDISPSEKLPSRSLFGDVVASTVQSVPRLGEQVGYALKYLDQPGGSDILRNAGQRLTEYPEELAKKYDIFKPSEESQAGGVGGFARRAVTGAFKELPSSVAPALAGGATGAAIGAAIPIPGATLAMGWAGATTATFGTFYAALYQQAYEDAIKQGLSEDKAKSVARRIGLIQGGLEAVTTPITLGFALGKNLVKSIFSAPIKQLGKDAAIEGAKKVITEGTESILGKTIKEIITPTARQLGKAYITTAPIEMTQEVVQDELDAMVRRQAGMEAPAFGESALEAVGPAAVMSGLMVGGGHVYNRRQIAAVKQSLEKADTKIETRKKAAQVTASMVAGESKNPVTAQLWLNKAVEDINAGRPVDVNVTLEDIIKQYEPTTTKETSDTSEKPIPQPPSTAQATPEKPMPPTIETPIVAPPIPTKAAMPEPGIGKPPQEMPKPTIPLTDKERSIIKNAGNIAVEQLLKTESVENFNKYQSDVRINAESRATKEIEQRYKGQYAGKPNVENRGQVIGDMAYAQYVADVSDAIVGIVETGIDVDAGMNDIIDALRKHNVNVDQIKSIMVEAHDKSKPELSKIYKENKVNKPVVVRPFVTEMEKVLTSKIKGLDLANEGYVDIVPHKKPRRVGIQPEMEFGKGVMQVEGQGQGQTETRQVAPIETRVLTEGQAATTASKSEKGGSIRVSKEDIQLKSQSEQGTSRVGQEPPTGGAVTALPKQAKGTVEEVGGKEISGIDTKKTDDYIGKLLKSHIRRMLTLNQAEEILVMAEDSGRTIGNIINDFEKNFTALPEDIQKRIKREVLHHTYYPFEPPKRNIWIQGSKEPTKEDIINAKKEWNSIADAEPMESVFDGIKNGIQTDNFYDLTVSDKVLLGLLETANKLYKEVDVKEQQAEIVPVVSPKLSAVTAPTEETSPETKQKGKTKQVQFEYDKTKVDVHPKMDSSLTNPALQKGQKSFDQVAQTLKISTDELADKLRNTITQKETAYKLSEEKTFEEFIKTHELANRQTVPVGELDLKIGDSFELGGEKFTVKYIDMEEGKFIIKDTDTYTVDSFDKIPLPDEGSIKRSKDYKNTVLVEQLTEAMPELSVSDAEIEVDFAIKPLAKITGKSPEETADTYIQQIKKSTTKELKSKKNILRQSGLPQAIEEKITNSLITKSYDSSIPKNAMFRFGKARGITIKGDMSHDQAWAKLRRELIDTPKGYDIVGGKPLLTDKEYLEGKQNEMLFQAGADKLWAYERKLYKEALERGEKQEATHIQRLERDRVSKRPMGKEQAETVSESKGGYSGLTYKDAYKAGVDRPVWLVFKKDGVEVAKVRSHSKDKELFSYYKGIMPEVGADMLTQEEMLLSEGTKYYQGKQGAIEFLPNGKAIIHILENANKSTFMHEMFHLYTKIMEQTPELRPQLTILEKWIGKPVAKWTTHDREKIARGGEQYLWEGNAPTSALKAVYEKFKTWLREIYKSANTLDVKLSDDVRKMWDEWFSGETVKAETLQAESEILFQSGQENLLKKLRFYFENKKIGDGYDTLVSLGQKIYNGGGIKQFMYDMKLVLGNLWEHYRRMLYKAWGKVSAEYKFTPLSELQNPMIRSIIEFWSPGSTLTDNIEYTKIRNDSRGSIEIIGRIVKKVLEKTRGFSEETNKQIFKFLDGKIELHKLPIDIRRYAVTLQSVNRRTGLMLVKRGLITKEAWERHKNEYIRYVYLKYLVDDNGITATGGKIDRDALKSRMDPIIKSRIAGKEYVDKNIYEGLLKVAENLGITHDRLIKAGRGKLGYATKEQIMTPFGFTEAGGKIVTQFATELSVLAHEIGHQLDYKYDLWDRIVTNAEGIGKKGEVTKAASTEKRGMIQEELRSLADLKFEGSEVSTYHKKYVRKQVEKMAHMLEAYIHAHERFKEISPTVYKEFDLFVNSIPELQGLSELKQGLALKELQQTAYQVVSASGKVYSGSNLTLKEAESIKEDVQKRVDKHRKAIGFVEDVSVAEPISITVALQNAIAYDRLAAISDNADWAWQPSVVVVDGVRYGIGGLKEEIKMQARLVVESPESKEIKERYDVLSQALVNAENQTGHTSEGFLELPTSPAYGKLSGMFVRKSIYRDLVPIFSGIKGDTSFSKTLNTLINTESQVMKVFKITHTALNVPTYVRNMVSNILQLNWSGIPLYDVPGYVTKAVKSLREKDVNYTQAFRRGIFKTNFIEGEIQELYETFNSMNPNSWFDIAAKLSKLGKYYGKIDDVFKLAKYIEQTEGGVSPDMAVIEAQKWGMDYSVAHPAIKYIRRHIIPFASYNAKITPLLLEAMVKRPWVVAKYFAIPSLMVALAQNVLDISDDEWDKLKNMLPLFMRKSVSFLPMPWKSDNGDLVWVNVESFFPGAMWLSLYRDTKNKDFWEMPRDVGVGNPFADFYAMIQSARGKGIPKDPYTGKELYSQLDTGATKATKTMGWFYNKMSPTMLTEFGTAGKLATIGKENKYGQKQTTGNAISSLFGINAYSPTQKQAMLEKMMKLRDLKNAFYRKMIDTKDTNKRIEIARRYLIEAKEIVTP